MASLPYSSILRRHTFNTEGRLVRFLGLAVVLNHG